MALLERWLAESAQLSSRGLPLVTMSYAQSLDGSLSFRRGEALALSGPESLALTHRLRAAHDAILVGIGTVLSDDPQLNVRLIEGEEPQVVILDSRLQIPLNAKLMKNKKKPWIFCSTSADSRVQEKLEGEGVRVERQNDLSAGQVNLKSMLARLSDLGIQSLMVEGGGRVINSFLREKLMDRAVITLAPIFVGGYKVAEEPLGGKLTGLPSLQDVQIEKAGEDIVIFGRFAQEKA